jgi:alkanesulfonate monooxygenase SsuD/methylene tetrahydromethanopterin reductase-like flavin-dependent oxidoreductase (luciferase family)
MTIDFGLVFPAGPRQHQINQWLDDLDNSLPELKGHFKSLWMTDHFFWADNPTYEAWTVLAFAAARWPQFELGPIVLGQSYRNPALLAKMGATLQTLCRGRFIMGVGAGWKEDEYHANGYSFPRGGIRVEQLEDTLEIIKRMWTEPGPVTYQGKHYSITNAYCEPKPEPVPPIIVGGGGRKTMMLAARYADWWSIPDANITDYKERVTILREHCATIGRDPASLRLTWFGRLAVSNSEAEAEGLSHGEWTRDNALVGTSAQVVEQLQRFIELGVDYFMVEVLGLSNPDIMRIVLEEVLPIVSR